MSIRVVTGIAARSSMRFMLGVLAMGLWPSGAAAEPSEASFPIEPAAPSAATPQPVEPGPAAALPPAVLAPVAPLPTATAPRLKPWDQPLPPVPPVPPPAASHREAPSWSAQEPGQPSGALPGSDTGGTGLADDDEQEESLKVLGVMLDGGLPDGVMLSPTYRPFSWLRMHAGAGTNSVSWGLRGGIAFIPFGLGPSLTVEAGHYFEGNANGVASRIAGSDYEDSAMLERIGYDFANAHLGLDFGMEKFVFYMHGGMSYLRTTLYNVNETLVQNGADGADSGTSLAVNGDPTLKGVVPSFKLGIVTYFL